ncbi:hypothetical protein L1987_38266 [Smallanthus sonchifolius]|uniref:Uncharacterized protein n=1 Tax=Smallanthus sonchifolius TaxID=185202 RepID=A0ACB9HK32_9ASTR|nr:hypothetical protein L1987_38266 [Smallanthus sonchifolius]
MPRHKASSSPSLEQLVALQAEEMKCGVGVVLTKVEAENESAFVELNDGIGNTDKKFGDFDLKKGHENEEIDQID